MRRDRFDQGWRIVLEDLGFILGLFGIFLLYCWTQSDDYARERELECGQYAKVWDAVRDRCVPKIQPTTKEK